MSKKNKDKIRSYSDTKLLRRIFGLTGKYRRVFMLAAFLSVILAPVSIIRPYLVQYTVDHHIIVSDSQGLLFMIAMLCSILMFEGFLSYVFTYCTGWLGQSIIRDLRVKVFNHINSLRLSYFDRTPIGTSTTRTISDIETIKSYLFIFFWKIAKFIGN